MRKKGWIIAGSIVGAVIVLWVVAALVIGGGTKPVLEMALEEAQVSSGGTISSAELVDYKKGMASSEGRSKFVVGPPNEEGVEIFLNHKIFHGPLMMTPSGMKVGTSHTVTTVDLESLPDSVKANVDRGFVSKTPLIVNVTTGFKSSAMDFEIAEYNNRIKSEDGSSARVVFDGVSGTMTGLGGTTSKGDMKLGQLKISSDSGMELALEPGTASMNGRKMVDGMMLDGDMRMELPRLSFKQEGISVAISDLVLSQNSSSSENGKAAITQTLSTGEIRLPKGEEFASAQSLISKGVEMEFSMAEMDVEQLKAMAETARELQKKQSAAADDPEAAEKVAMEQLKIMLEMVQPGMELGIGLDLRGDAGRSTVDIDLKWVSGDPLVKGPDVKRLISGIRADVKAVLPAKLMEDPGMGMIIGMAADQKALVVGEEKIEGTASLIHSSATLNGETFPLKEMLGPMMDMPLDWDAIFSGAMTLMGPGAVPVDDDPASTPIPPSTPVPAPVTPAPVTQPKPVEN